MIKDLLQNKILEYHPKNILEQENILAELMQLFVLSSLSRSGFFLDAEFHGGTCLRVMYEMPRFSEDLDFLLKKPNPQFKWTKYLDRVKKDCSLEGIHFEIQDKSELKTAVKKAFLKTDSIGKVISLELPYTRRITKKVKIKLEIDCNPPKGSIYETRYISFPTTSPITTQTLESGFATKSHALLCRNYTKGRDWYDFLWYISKKIIPNYSLLEDAIDQQGPWCGQKVKITKNWYIKELREKIKKIIWRDAKKDVQRFIMSQEQNSLSFWNVDFFLFHVEKLENYLY